MSTKRPPNKYTRILDSLFLTLYKEGQRVVPFSSKDVADAALRAGVQVRNPADVRYSARYSRNPLSGVVQKTAAPGFEWVIKLAGTGRYEFVLVPSGSYVVKPQELLSKTKVPDSTPGLIEQYAFDDEQALLARIRYNRLIDLFSGLVCYSLQNHLKTSSKSHGQIEIDEIYLGIDPRGVQTVLPVEAKGLNETVTLVQIEQDFAACAEKFSRLLCRPVAAQVLDDGAIALFEFNRDSAGVLSLVREQHFLLVAPEEISAEELAQYRQLESLE